MAIFFDADLANDANMLHHTVRNHGEMSRVVDRAEIDILNRFSIRIGVNSYRVELEGYNDATPANSNALLMAAIKRSVADVASYRLRYLDRDSSLQKERLGDYEADRGTASGTLNVSWPESWDKELTGFYSERAPLFHV
tara:strand:- start:1429 stop:1845 length:417 start_codon:yes stop_codon:yes gene_type:complete